MALYHALGARRHGNREHDDQAGRDHGEPGRHRVDDDLLPRLEPVGREHDDGADDGDGEQHHGELAQLALQRRAHVDAQEPAQRVAQRQGVGLEVARRVRAPVGPALDRPHLRLLLAQRRRDGAHLGAGARREHDAPRPALGHGRAAVRHVQAVARARLVVEDLVGRLADGQGLAGEEGLVRLEVLGFHQSWGACVSRGIPQCAMQ